MDTRALQQAIDDCGDGQAVYLPAGGISYRSASGCTVIWNCTWKKMRCCRARTGWKIICPGSGSRFEGTELECYSSLLNLGELDHDGGYRCQNVVIRGKGPLPAAEESLAERVICFRARAPEGLSGFPGRENKGM